MWRSSLQLPPADKAESEPVTIGSAQGKLFEIGDGKTPGRILVAALDRDGLSWYFKMRGDDSVVRDQKPAFLEFLKSISFEAAPAMAMADPHAGMSAGTAPAAAPVNFDGTLPVGWKEIPNPQMLLAKYVIQWSGDAKAEVNISMLAGQGGGVMMNVTRWRGQAVANVGRRFFQRSAHRGRGRWQGDPRGYDWHGREDGQEIAAYWRHCAAGK